MQLHIIVLSVITALSIINVLGIITALCTIIYIGAVMHRYLFTLGTISKLFFTKFLLEKIIIKYKRKDRFLDPKHYFIRAEFVKLILKYQPHPKPIKIDVFEQKYALVTTVNYDCIEYYYSYMSFIIVLSISIYLYSYL